MKAPDTISVVLDGDRKVELRVEEFQPFDPAAYQLDSGWTCLCPCCEREYFVSTSGEVYVQPENIVVGISPALKEQADRIENLLQQDE
jgi:hypothetical protein